jgi:hypothetical protein
MSDFQHKHYVRIANMLAKMASVQDRNKLIEEFIVMFGVDNPRFDPARFMDAANGKPQNGRDKPRN